MLLLKRFIALAFSFCALQALPALKASDLEDLIITKGSPYTLEETCQRISSKCHSVGFQLLGSYPYNSKDGKQSSIVFLFKNEKLEQALIQSEALAALFLPFKLVVWQNDSKNTYVSYMLASILEEVDILEDESILNRITKEIEHLTDEITFAPLPNQELS
jgi:uncharacterized protein (DUF302 family)